MQTVAVVAAELLGVVSLLGQPIFKIIHLKKVEKWKAVSFLSLTLFRLFSHLR